MSMSAKEVGEKLVQLCKEGKNEDAIEQLYGDDVVSVESVAAPGMDRTAKGKDAVRGKGKWWAENHEIHESSVEGPWPHGDEKFAVAFKFDVTNKPSGQRMKMDEIAVYTVDAGKVVREEFFYNMG